MRGDTVIARVEVMFRVPKRKNPLDGIIAVFPAIVQSDGTDCMIYDSRYMNHNLKPANFDKIMKETRRARPTEYIGLAHALKNKDSADLVWVNRRYPIPEKSEHALRAHNAVAYIINEARKQHSVLGLDHIKQRCELFMKDIKVNDILAELWLMLIGKEVELITGDHFLLKPGRVEGYVNRLRGIYRLRKGSVDWAKLPDEQIIMDLIDDKYSKRILLIEAIIQLAKPDDIGLDASQALNGLADYNWGN